MITDPRQARTTRHGLRSRTVRMLVVTVLAISLPAIALASHQFSDVPASNPFHGPIDRLVGTGITAGCGGGRFCPKSAVTREQMAAFLARGLGRTSLGIGSLYFDEADEFYVATVRMVTGGASHLGGGFTNINATVTLFTDIAGLCPCSVYAYLVNLRTDAILNTSFTTFTISDEAASNDWRAGNGTLNMVVETPGGESNTYGLAVDLVTTGTPPTGGSGPDNASLHGSLTADYFPFGPTGGSTLDQSQPSFPSVEAPMQNKRSVKPGS